MVEITFVNVGQGDTIIIEWLDDSGKKKIGIIDCNIYNNQNPIIQYLSSSGSGYTSIEFLVLSHPHIDHFSGIKDLLLYCTDRKILITEFYSTISEIAYTITEAFLSQRKKKELYNLMEQIEDSSEELQNPAPILKVIKKHTIVHHNLDPIIFASDIQFKFHSPILLDYLILAKIYAAYNFNNQTGTPPNLNSLSSIIEIHSKGNYILLTSDAVKRQFQRIAEDFKGSSLILSQVPHHGSANNLEKTFWLSLKFNKGTPAVFSVGDEPQDKLPKKPIVDFFASNGFEIYSTNNVHGITEFLGNTTTSNPVLMSNLLNMVSVKRSTTNALRDRYNGDKKFLWDTVTNRLNPIP